eukprot:6859550-Pyramimonas_sp.AAC.1
MARGRDESSTTRAPVRAPSLRGHEARGGCAKMHAGDGDRACGWAPYGAVSRVRGAPKWGGTAVQAAPCRGLKRSPR